MSSDLVGDTLITHQGGVPWDEAPIPRRLHRHWAQSTVVLSSGLYCVRCPCGATRYSRKGWLGRNSRQRGDH